MKSESDAKTPGRRILRVVVVASDKDIGGISVEDEDGNPAIQVRVRVETSEKGEGGVNVWFDSLGSTVYRGNDPADFAGAAGYELELMAERLEEEDFSSEDRRSLGYCRMGRGSVAGMHAAAG